MKIQGKIVGKVTDEERNEIRMLFERKNGLKELFQVISHENEYLYEKVLKDMGETSHKFQEWWNEKSLKYNWENVKGHSWEIDFDTCDIYLV